jgi:hypothetical protein
MKFTVVWHPSAVDQLIALWLEAADRQAVTAAADEIDPALREDPILRGETLVATFRILVIEPLQVVYRVRDADRTVQILSLRRAVDDETDVE